MTEPGLRQGSVSLPGQRDGSDDALPAATRQQTPATTATPADTATATATAINTVEDTDMLVVRTWGSEVAIRLGRVARVAQLPAITPIPGDRRSRVGVVRFEERTIPVDDLGMLLGMSPASRYTLDHTLVVLESGGELVGIIVEPQVELLGDLLQSEMTELPSDHPTPLTHVLSRGTRHIPVLDVERIVATTHGYLV